VTPSIGPQARELLDSGRLDLPLPGGGATLDRFAALADLGEVDLDVARLAEAHTDAQAILAELSGPELSGPELSGPGLSGPELSDPGRTAEESVEPGSRALWGVWAADPPVVVLEARRSDDPPGWSLSGAKPWCSGATLCGRALVTAHAEDGYRLFAIDPGHPGVTVRASRWEGLGMRGSDTRDLDLVDVPARPVGGPDAYLDRVGFWWGAAGVAAVWLGGARGVAAALTRAAARHDADLVCAALGRVDAAQHAAWCTLAAVARLADGAGAVDTAAARLAAARARAAVETAVEVTLHETARATGPAPLAMDQAHARQVADLQVYVRQSHGDRDLAVLGRLAAAAAGGGGR
jgi:hypothetical protein